MVGIFDNVRQDRGGGWPGAVGRLLTPPLIIMTLRVTIILNISDSFSEDTPRLLGKHFSNQKAEADLGQSQKAES